MHALSSAASFSSELISQCNISRLSPSCFHLFVFTLLWFMVASRGVQKAVPSSIQEAAKTTVWFLVCHYFSVIPYLPVKMTFLSEMLSEFFLIFK